MPTSGTEHIPAADFFSDADARPRKLLAEDGPLPSQAAATTSVLECLLLGCAAEGPPLVGTSRGSLRSSMRGSSVGDAVIETLGRRLSTCAGLGEWAGWGRAGR